MLKLLAVPLALIALSFGLVACGGSDDDNSGASSTPSTSATAQNDGPTSSSSPSSGGTSGTQEVAVKAGERGDQYYFEVSNTNLKTGKIKVTMDNAGPERQHTFVVKKLDGSGNIAEIKQVDPRTSGTVEFELTSAGTYEFQCDLRGHADRGQKGSFTVTS